MKTQRINPEGVFSSYTYSCDILNTVAMEHLRSHPSKWSWPLLVGEPRSAREEKQMAYFFLHSQIRLRHIRHICHQVPNTITSIWSSIRSWWSSLFSIYIFAKIWRWHFTWTLPMNQTCIVSLQINRFLYYPASFIGYRCQTTRAVIHKVATAHHEDYWYRQYGQHHQRYTDNHSPWRKAVELLRSLSNPREKILIHIYLKKSTSAVLSKACSFQTHTHLYVTLYPQHGHHYRFPIWTVMEMYRITIFLPVSKTKTLSPQFLRRSEHSSRAQIKIFTLGHLLYLSAVVSWSFKGCWEQTSVQWCL